MDNSSSEYDPDPQEPSDGFRSAECEKENIHIDSVAFYRYVSIPAVVLMIAFTLLKQYQTHGKGGFFNKLAIVRPVDLINQRHHRFPYVAAFNVAAFALWALIDDWSKLLGVTTIRPLSSLLKLSVCLLLATMFYPIFAAISSDHILGYAMGMLYTWGITTYYVLGHIPCKYRPGADIFMLFEIAECLPCLIWLLYLCLWFPYKIIKRIKSGKKVSRCEQQATFHRQYVHRLINNKNQSPIQYRISYGKPGSKVEKITKLILKHIYAPVDGFRYPVSMLAATTVSITLVWTMSINLLHFYYYMAAVVQSLVEGLFGPKDDESLKRTMVDYAANRIKEMRQFQQAKAVVDSIKASLYVSFAIAALLIILSMLLTLKNYRRHILHLYKGVSDELPVMDKNAPRDIVVASTKYVGYQFAYSLWGFTIQAILLMLICIGISAIVVYIFIYENYQFLLDKLYAWGPLFAYIYAMLIIQQLLVHFLFLQKDANGKRILALCRLLCFCNFQYFLIFANAALGIVSCFLRIVKSAALGAFTLTRLDMSVFNRHFERKDPGFNAYVCLLTLENTQTNPKMLTFVELLWESIGVINGRPQNDVPLEVTTATSESKIDRSTRSRRKKLIRNRWQVLLTLYRNPFLRHYRHSEKGAVNAFMIATQMAKLDLLIMAQRKMSASQTTVDA